MVEKYIAKDAEKMGNSKYVEDDEGVEDDPNDIIEKVDELCRGIGLFQPLL